MSYLLDTSVCVAALRAHEPTLRRLAAVAPREVAVSAMTTAELWYGVLKSRSPDATGRELERFLALIDVLPFDDAAARHHARTHRALEAQGIPIGERDLVIAATALAHDRTVASGNSREFTRVAGLVVEDWTRG